MFKGEGGVALMYQSYLCPRLNIQSGSETGGFSGPLAKTVWIMEIGQRGQGGQVGERGQTILWPRQRGTDYSSEWGSEELLTSLQK